jgi:hypothetical protein
LSSILASASSVLMSSSSSLLSKSSSAAAAAAVAAAGEGCGAGAEDSDGDDAFFRPGEDVSGGRGRFPVRWRNDVDDERLRRFVSLEAPVEGRGVGTDWARLDCLAPKVAGPERAAGALAGCADCCAADGVGSGDGGSSAAWRHSRCSRKPSEFANGGLNEYDHLYTPEVSIFPS